MHCVNWADIASLTRSLGHTVRLDDVVVVVLVEDPQPRKVAAVWTNTKHQALTLSRGRVVSSHSSAKVLLVVEVGEVGPKLSPSQRVTGPAKSPGVHWSCLDASARVQWPRLSVGVDTPHARLSRIGAIILIPVLLTASHCRGAGRGAHSTTAHSHEVPFIIVYTCAIRAVGRGPSAT